MSEIKTINELPYEILIKILKYLNWPDTGNAALTCKLWKELTDDSCLWCVSLNYLIHPDPAKLHFLRRTNRKFHTIKVRGVIRTLEDFALIKLLGHAVVKLIWIGNYEADVRKFSELLHCMPNLQHISLFGGIFEHYNDDPIQMRKLKSLEVSNCVGRILELFQIAKLDTFTLHLQRETPMGLREFLSSQPDIDTTLIVEPLATGVPRRFSLKDLSELKFRLSNLSLSSDRWVDNSNGILRLLQANAETLIELELSGHLKDFIYEFIFSKLKRLKSLKMSVSNAPKDIRFYERLEISHLNSLTLIEPPVHCEHFFMRLPDIKSLTLLNCRKNFLKSISDKLSELTTLSLDSGNQLTTERILIPSIKTLHIRTLSHNIDWDGFTKVNDQLTELIIDNVERKEFMNVLDITNNTNLRVLSIGKCFTASDSTLRFIRSNCPLLRVLILGSENFS
ncbi:hypothetical protein HA402_001939 [Bradysia odoriphaga]|nr:hypothetical protein HA402_001939 [Bradysia odoriphaga]